LILAQKENGAGVVPERSDFDKSVDSRKLHRSRGLGRLPAQKVRAADNPQKTLDLLG
jgi:hypothetical protein